MNVHVSYKAGKSPEVEQELEHQILKLQRRLQVFKPGLVHLHAFVEQENRRHASSSLNLRLPTGQMAAQRSGGNALAAVKAAFADLLSQVTKHKELLRGHWKARPSLRPGKQGPPLRALDRTPNKVKEAHVPPAAIAANTLATWVNANLYRLQEFVDNELQMLVAGGQLRDGQICREEVIDEVMVSALSEEDSNAQIFALKNWFHRLALQAIRRLAKSSGDTGTLSLDAPAGTQNVTGSDENVLQYHQPDDSLPEESVIRDASARTPEEIFASSEMVAQLDLVLHEVSPPHREAFVLYTLEGFTVEEISRLTDRPPDLVRKAIQQARERIQKKLPEQNRFRQTLLSRSRVA